MHLFRKASCSPSVGRVATTSPAVHLRPPGQTDVVLRVLGTFLRRRYYIKKNQNGADGDGGIGDIEGRPRIENAPRKEREPDFEEVGDGTVNDAIGEVAGGSAEQKREARGSQRATAVAGDKQPGEHADDHDGAGD